MLPRLALRMRIEGSEIYSSWYSVRDIGEKRSGCDLRPRLTLPSSIILTPLLGAIWLYIDPAGCTGFVR